MELDWNENGSRILTERIADNRFVDEEACEKLIQQSDDIIKSEQGTYCGAMRLSVKRRLLNLRHQGDDFMISEQYRQAIETYTQAIRIAGQVDSTVKASLYCNRAIAFMKLEEYPSATRDSEKAMELDPNWVVPHYCHGYSCISTNRLDVGHASLRKIMRSLPCIRFETPHGLWFGGKKDSKKKYKEDMLKITKLDDYNCDLVLPLGWTIKESRVYPGKIYYYNKPTKKMQWIPPKVQPFKFVRINVSLTG